MALNRPQDAMGDAATAAAMAENDADAQALVQEVTRGLGVVAGRAGAGGPGHPGPDRAARQEPGVRGRAPGTGQGPRRSKRQADAALVELQKAVELDPKNAEAWFQIGFAYHVSKQNAAAAAPAYEKAVAADPGNPTYRTNLGAVLAETGQVDRAVAELTKVTTQPGYNRADAWIYLGGAHLGAKKYKEAIDALEQGGGHRPPGRHRRGLPGLVATSA